MGWEPLSKLWESIRSMVKRVLIKPNEDIMKRKIFKQEQIARAVELGLGASSPSEIDVEPVNPESQ
jgi:hypothetical protein